MSVDGVRRVQVAGGPLLDVACRRGIHPSLILTRHDIVARIGPQLHHPRFWHAFSRSYTAARAYTARDLKKTAPRGRLRDTPDIRCCRRDGADDAGCPTRPDVLNGSTRTLGPRGADRHPRCPPEPFKATPATRSNPH